MTFTNWISRYKEEQSAIGGLARSIQSDLDWPVEGDYSTLRRYAFLHRDHNEQFVLQTAWKEYRRVAK